MKIRRHKLSIVSACLLTLVIIACQGQQEADKGNLTSSPGSTPRSTTSPRAETNSQPTTNVYPEQAVKRFTDRCVKRRGTKAKEICDCSIKEIQNKYSFEEYRKIIKDARASGEPADEFREITKSCRTRNSQSQSQ